MSRLIIFFIIIILSALVTTAYLLWGLLIAVPAAELDDENPYRDRRVVYIIRAIIMYLCPVVGPLYVGVGYFIYRVVFRQQVDLDDVIFSKERVRMHIKADEETERNMVPLEEALAVSDKKNLRALMMNIIKGDITKSLATIMLALNSQDSETSHYAASVLRDELNDFRMNVQKLYKEIENEEENDTEYEIMLIDYMGSVLKQKVFAELEQERFVKIFADTMDKLYLKDRSKITVERYESLCIMLLDSKLYDDMRIWCERLKEQYFWELPAYTCFLKLYFTLGDKENFFAVMKELKESEVVIDNETLQLMKIFG